MSYWEDGTRRSTGNAFDTPEPTKLRSASVTYRVTGLARLAGASPVDPPVMQRLVKALHY